MDSPDWPAFAKFAAKSGFDSYHSPGPQSRDDRPSGGLVTLVREGVSRRFGDRRALLLLSSLGFTGFFINLYSTPHHE